MIDEDHRAFLVGDIREGRVLSGEQRELLINLIYAADAAARYGPADAAIGPVVAAYTALIEASGGAS